MEVKKVIEVQDNAHLQDKQFHNKPAALVAAVEVEVQQPVEDNDKVLKKNDGLNTPTSPLKTIQPILTCPPAPRKPKADDPLRKRKGSHIKTALRLLDYSNDVLALYPPALLADFGNKVKKAKRSGYPEQLKENIGTNLNYYPTKLQNKHDKWDSIS